MTSAGREFGGKPACAIYKNNCLIRKLKGNVSLFPSGFESSSACQLRDKILKELNSDITCFIFNLFDVLVSAVDKKLKYNN